MLKRALFIMGVVGLMFSCNINPGPGIEGEGEISFNYTLESYFARVIPKDLSRALESITGELVAKNLNSGEEQTFNWYGTVDEELFEIKSTKTIKLPPGDYDFSLVLTKGNFKYSGKALMYTIADGENVVPLTMRPVFGEVMTQAQLLELASLRVKYPPGELAGLTDISIGVVIDDNPEVLLKVNPATGISEQYINLAPGVYNIHLNLYNGGMLVGLSEEFQENVDLELTRNVTIDIRPLYGETIFELTLAGGDAKFIHVIPYNVVEEAGSLDNLGAYFNLTGTVNGTKEYELTFVENPDGTFSAEVIIPDMYYDVVDMYIEYYDIAADEKIAFSAVDGLELTMNDIVITWLLELRRRAYISGHLMSVVGINTFLNDLAEEGVSIYANDQFMGITGSGGFGTPGYLNIHLIPGDYTIKAEKGLWGKEENITLSPLEVTNLDLILEELKEPLILFSNNDYGCGWNSEGSALTTEISFKLGTNIAAYSAAGESSMVIGHISHNGDWNPDPSSMANLEAEIERRTGMEVTTMVVDLESADLSDVELLYITGHDPFTMNSAQRGNLKTFIKNGGVLFADDCEHAGGVRFENSLRTILNETFGSDYEALPGDHKVYSSFYELNGNDYSHSDGGLGTQWNQQPLYFLPL